MRFWRIARRTCSSPVCIYAKARPVQQGAEPLSSSQVVSPVWLWYNLIIPGLMAAVQSGVAMYVGAVMHCWGNVRGYISGGQYSNTAIHTTELENVYALGVYSSQQFIVPLP